MQELVPAAELPVVVVVVETSAIVIVGLYEGTFQRPITVEGVRRIWNRYKYLYNFHQRVSSVNCQFARKVIYQRITSESEKIF